MLRKTPKYERIAFVASPAPEARKALKRLVKLYGNVSPSRADVVVALAAWTTTGRYRYWPVVSLSLLDTRTNTTLARLMTTAFSPSSRL